MTTRKPVQVPDDADLIRQLNATPGLDLGRNGRLVRVASADRRTDQASRAKFEWVSTEGVRYNLVAGRGVAEEYANTQAFFRAFPDLGIRPAALLRLPGADVAVFEHFEGMNLEALLADGSVSVDEARRLLDRLMDRLESEAVPVPVEEGVAALDALLAEVRGQTVWGTLDRLFLDTTVPPLLRRTLASAGLRRRWTNGDFVARNILVNRRGECRLRDCEFAACTPFAASDFLRFGEFSDVPEELRDQVRRRVPGDPRWWRIHFCLDQAGKLALVRSPEAFHFDAEALLERLLQETQEGGEQRPASCLFRSRADYEALSKHAVGLREQYDALHKHARGVREQYDALLKHANGLQEQYDALLKHVNGLQEQYETLLKHADGLLEQWNLLERHASALQQANETLSAQVDLSARERAALLRRIDLLKHPWRRLRRRSAE
jgi:hypothetical protein